MKLNPALIPTSPQESSADRMAALERRVSALESSSPIQVGTGAPTAAVRNGAPYGQQDTPRMWLRLNGTWRYVGLT